LGIYPARVDDKGRLKLPTLFQEYLRGLADQRLFATSLDRRMARIYPISCWLDTENKLRGARGEDAKRAKRVHFTSQALGAACEMDAQGRVLLSPELRRALAIENQGVWIVANQGRIDVMSDALYRERTEESSATAPEDVEVLEMAGLA
jgi:MraZ protein